MAAAAVCLGLLSSVSPAAAGARAAAGTGAVFAGTWGNAEEVPGIAALNRDGNAEINSVSCGSAGSCSAGGYYVDGSGHYQAFVASEANGTWGTAEEVPGTAALNTGGSAVINSASCASVGSCSAGGLYHTVRNRGQAFVVKETNGIWGTAREVPGIAALSTGGSSAIGSVSCSSAGNCSAGGGYTSHNISSAFVVGQTNGTWGTAEQFPGIAALSRGGGAWIDSVSCISAGNCSVGGGYRASAFLGRQTWVAVETNGTWGTAEEAPGVAALNKGKFADIVSVSCGSAGNCSADGTYRTRVGNIQPFVVGEANGTWGTARKVPGIAALNQGGNAQISPVSCTSAGNCSVGGSYTDGSGHQQAFVASEANGTWGTAEEVPGTAALNTGGNAHLNSVSCTSAGNCSAGGSTQTVRAAGRHSSRGRQAASGVPRRRFPASRH